ncbi:N-acetylneuraminate cytidylyltransferase [Lachnospiraceae bacterium KM106-2]|nr:N-acetylneuraminate cytidylyltransferase [Lachnospiraceae bacterium KM106-2]
MDDLEIFNVNSYYNTGESDADFYDEVDFLSGVDGIDDYDQPVKITEENTTDNIDFLDHVDFLDGIQDEMDYLDIKEEHNREPIKVVSKQEVKTKEKVKQNEVKKESDHSDKYRHYLTICCLIGTLCLVIIILIFSWKLFGPEKQASVASNKSNGVWPYEASAKQVKNTGGKAASTASNKTKELMKQKVLFVGNSRTVSLQLSGAFKNATYFAKQGLNVKTSQTIELKVKGQTMSLLQLLKKKKFDRVYIMLGTNELGWPYTYKFESSYTQLIDQVKKAQPNTKVYLQSILPVTNKRAKKDSVYNNKKISKFNKSVKNVAKATSSKYVDVGKALAQKDGSLPEEASTDGIHLNQKFCYKWIEYLKKVK